MQKNKRVLILGGGISGLSLAHFLKNKADVTLIEKKNDLGGWMISDHAEDLFFERGPRTFKPSKSSDLLSLIHDLSLQDQVIFSDPRAKKRYIYRERKLRQVGLFSKDVLSLLPTLFKEWNVPALHEDETIYNFISRRFSKKIAENLFDPLVLGMFGGDIRHLSIASCFPQLKSDEITYGSVLKALIKKEKQDKAIKGLFTLKRGMGDLIAKLSVSLDIRKEEVIRLETENDKVLVHTSKDSYSPDIVVSALPHLELARLCKSFDQTMAETLESIPSLAMVLFQIGYNKKVLLKKGFGYLVPSHEKEDVMGVVFDSEVFPMQNSKENETRLTMMCRDVSKSDEDWKSYVKKKLQEHLCIHDAPNFLAKYSLKNALPQYHLGHRNKIVSLESKMSLNHPNFYLAGNYLEGVSVNDCIKRAKKIADHIKNLR